MKTTNTTAAAAPVDRVRAVLETVLAELDGCAHGIAYSALRQLNLASLTIFEALEAGRWDLSHDGECVDDKYRTESELVDAYEDHLDVAASAVLVEIARISPSPAAEVIADMACFQGTLKNRLAGVNPAYDNRDRAGRPLPTDTPVYLEKNAAYLAAQAVLAQFASKPR